MRFFHIENGMGSQVPFRILMMRVLLPEQRQGDLGSEECRSLPPQPEEAEAESADLGNELVLCPYPAIGRSCPLNAQGSPPSF